MVVGVIRSGVDIELFIGCFDVGFEVKYVRWFESLLCIELRLKMLVQYH